MKRFLIVVCISVFAFVGWKLGVFVGPVTAYLLSGLFGIGGYMVGWKVDRMLTE